MYHNTEKTPAKRKKSHIVLLYNLKTKVGDIFNHMEANFKLHRRCCWAAHYKASDSTEKHIAVPQSVGECVDHVPCLKKMPKRGLQNMLRDGRLRFHLC